MLVPAIGVVVPVYNRPRVVLEALESIAAQTAAPHALIVVDDGSTDDTAPRIQAWLDARRLPFPTRLIRQDNAGAAAARNRGVRALEGCGALAFLDSDDLWPPDYVARAGMAFHSNRDCVAATADIAMMGRRGRTRIQRSDHLRGPSTAALLPGGQAYPSATVVQAAAFHRVGGFDENYRVFEDYYLFLRLSLLGNWACIPGAPVTRRMDRGAGDHSRGFSGGFSGGDSGGAPQLTATLDSPIERGAALAMMQRFLSTDGGDRAVPAAVRRRTLGQLWYQAGRAHAGARNFAQASHCLRQAVWHDAWHLRAWRRLAAAQFHLWRSPTPSPPPPLPGGREAGPTTPGGPPSAKAGS